MANYRPKSLDDLNNLYDRSISAQNAIQKSGSAIADSGTGEVKEKAVDVVEEAPAAKEKTASQIASDELAKEVSNFMKTFGEHTRSVPEQPVAVQAVPAPVTKTVKSAPAKQKNQKESDEKASQKPVQKLSSQKPDEKIRKEKDDEARNLERDELFNDYMRIMNDEDDEGSSVRSKFKRNKKDKHKGSPIDDENESDSLSEENGAPEEETNEVKKEKKPKKEKPEKKQKKSKDVSEEPQKDDAEEFTDFFGHKEKDEVAAVPKRKKSKKQVAAQVLLILILLSVLSCALVTGLLKVVVGVNTADSFADKYYLFTAGQAYPDAGIGQGDFIVTQNREIAENEALAFLDPFTNKISFGTRGSLLGNDSFMVHSDSGVSLVSSATVKGAVALKIPYIGAIVSVAMENFVFVIALLVTLAVMLILILALAFRSSSDYADEAFDQEEPEEEYEDFSEAEEYDTYDETEEYEDYYEEDYEDGYYEYDDESYEHTEKPDIYNTID